MSVKVIRVGRSTSRTEVIRIGRSAGSGTHWWRGEGPPPELIVGSRYGDFYWDINTGNVFELMPSVSGDHEEGS